MADSFKERADALTKQWDQLKAEYQEQSWMKRRVRLLQKKKKTPEEEQELETLCNRLEQDRIFGSLEDRSLDKRFFACIEALELTTSGGNLTPRKETNMTRAFVLVYYMKDLNPIVLFTDTEQEAETRLNKAQREFGILSGYVCRVLSEWEPKLTKKEN